MKYIIIVFVFIVRDLFNLNFLGSLKINDTKRKIPVMQISREIKYI